MDTYDTFDVAGDSAGCRPGGGLDPLSLLLSVWLPPPGAPIAASWSVARGAAEAALSAALRAARRAARRAAIPSALALAASAGDAACSASALRPPPSLAFLVSVCLALPVMEPRAGTTGTVAILIRGAASGESVGSSAAPRKAHNSATLMSGSDAGSGSLFLLSSVSPVGL